MVKDIFKLSNSGQDVYDLRMGIAHSVVKCVRSNGQGPICGAVKWSSNKNDGQNFLTPVTAVTTAPMGVTTPCKTEESRHVGSNWSTNTQPSLSVAQSAENAVTSRPEKKRRNPLVSAGVASA